MKFIDSETKNWINRQGYSKKILLSEEDLKSKGNLIQIIRNKAHTEIKPHYHKTMIEVYHVLKGKALVFCGDIRVRTKPGDTLLCEPGEIHGLVNDTDSDFEIIVFKMNAEDSDMYWV